MMQKSDPAQATPDSTLGSLVDSRSHPDLIRIAARPGGLNAMTIRSLAAAPRQTLIDLGEMRGMDVDLCDEILAAVTSATGVADLGDLADWVMTPGWSATPLHEIARAMPHALRIAGPLEAHAAGHPAPTAGDAIREPEDTLARIVAAGVPRSIASDVMGRIAELIGARERRQDDSPLHAIFLEDCRKAAGPNPDKWQTVAAMCGFGGERPILPEDIALTRGVTRSRAHQWKDSALKKIRATPALDAARGILGGGKAAFLAISGGQPAIGPLSEREALRRLSPVQSLCVLITSASIRAWLDANATPYGSGWIAPGMRAGAVKSAIGTLAESGALRRPMPPGRICANSNAAAAAAILAGEAVQDGYVGTSFPRQARTARLHEIATRKGWPCFDIRDLATAYWRENPSDTVRARNIQIALKGEGSHLLLQVLDDIWMSLDAIGKPIAPLARVPHAAGEDDDPDDDWTGSWTGKVTTPPSTQVPIKRPEWPWVWTPGIIRPDYDRPQDHPLHGSWRAIGIGLKAGAGYALAMRSGAPRNLFRPWGPGYERAYAEAALASGDTDLCDSILTQSRISEWPGTEAELAEWSKRAEVARWSLEPASSVRSGEATAMDTLKALAWAWCFGTIGAPACAQIRGRSVADDASIPLLRALARAGALEHPGDETLAWRQGPAFGAILAAMRDHVMAAGSADWDTEAFSAVGRHLGEAVQGGGRKATRQWRTSQTRTRKAQRPPKRGFELYPTPRQTEGWRPLGTLVKPDEWTDGAALITFREMGYKANKMADHKPSTRPFSAAPARKGAPFEDAAGRTRTFSTFRLAASYVAAMRGERGDR